MSHSPAPHLPQPGQYFRCLLGTVSWAAFQLNRICSIWVQGRIFSFPTIIKCWTLCQERHRWNRSLRFGCLSLRQLCPCPHHPYQQWVFRGPAYLDVASAIVWAFFWRCICLCCCSGSLWVWCEEGHHLWSDTWEALSKWRAFVAFAVDKCALRFIAPWILGLKNQGIKKGKLVNWTLSNGYRFSEEMRFSMKCSVYVLDLWAVNNCLQNKERKLHLKFLNDIYTAFYFISPTFQCSYSATCN